MGTRVSQFTYEKFVGNGLDIHSSATGETGIAAMGMRVMRIKNAFP